MIFDTVNKKTDEIHCGFPQDIGPPRPPSPVKSFFNKKKIIK